MMERGAEKTSRGRKQEQEQKIQRHTSINKLKQFCSYN